MEGLVGAVIFIIVAIVAIWLGTEMVQGSAAKRAADERETKKAAALGMTLEAYRQDRADASIKRIEENLRTIESQQSEEKIEKPETVNQRRLRDRLF